MATENIEDNIFTKTFYALGTVNNIKVYGNCNDEIMKKAVERVFEIENIMSAFKPDSDISKIRQNAGYGFQKVQEETYQLIEKAIKYSYLSEGAFDITIRPLVELWGINKKGSYVPSDSDINQVLKLVNFQDIQLDHNLRSVALRMPGQAIDLGSIAKGYAADEVKRILRENGIEKALINLGGNVITIGTRPNGEKWKIGIQNPLAATGSYLGVLSVTDKTIVTSGSNERFFIKDGIRYHHILDPRNGKPANSSLLSVTAVCDSSADADALTTALFILGPENSKLLLEKTKTKAIFVTENLTEIVSNGLTDDYKNSK